MDLLYATTNQSKISFMRNCLKQLDITISSLADISLDLAEMPKIVENGNSPLDNAKIKALAYYKALRVPLFSCDSGLYIDGLSEERQPGINVRGTNDHMNDAEAIAYYSALAAEMGGKMTARYKNAICLILENGQIHEHMADDIASPPFHIVDKPHNKRKIGFPLDSLSVNIESGQYYFDEEVSDKYENHDGFAKFFRRVLGI
ncbi:MAG: hypothetical protein FWG63_03210 [Defluviitaleaceae bacterium]|nr:hypothetical protein [Defluviitaleaceae bacterium]